MKQNFIKVGAGLLLLATVILVLTSGLLTLPSKPAAHSATKGFAVIELFTSEGCSSCPAADAAVERIAAANPGKVFVLGFHVDYWNRLGWTDSFSKTAYSARQRAYADYFKLEGVYTPQVVVNGSNQMVGSDNGRLQKAVVAGIDKAVNRPVELLASQPAANTVKVAYQLDTLPSNTDVNIALLQIVAQTHVQRGENKGRTLKHIDIVQDFKTLNNSSKTGAVVFDLPRGISANNCKLLLYVQHRQTKEITAVAETLIR
ncbi:MAG: hypothetical protein JWP81_3845 [Ferruginibacter sp.]|nr:hypothetical protein [Ferruginibacter sp.]